MKDLFYECMFACCIEIVLFTYSCPHKFPWILEALGIEAINFVKVIELIVRSKEPLAREIVKHLSRVSRNSDTSSHLYIIKYNTNGSIM